MVVVEAAEAEADHPEVVQVVVVDSQRHGQEIVGDNKDQRTQI